MGAFIDSPVFGTSPANSAAEPAFSQGYWVDVQVKVMCHAGSSVAPGGNSGNTLTGLPPILAARAPQPGQSLVSRHQLVSPHAECASVSLIGIDLDTASRSSGRGSDESTRAGWNLSKERGRCFPNPPLGEPDGCGSWKGVRAQFRVSSRKVRVGTRSGRRRLGQ